ncbi:MAG TPA: hypothetical protein VMH00_03565 [Candidatus Limnocylindrales bacterium]|nr:hypothetical protein [Candidatus Limnocylindrales bacterium]
MSEAKIEHYRGVLCGYCRQPIPLPGIVDQIAANERESGIPARSFHLRCRVCEREKPYRTRDIAEFEGAPRPRFSAERAFRLVHSQAKVAKAANG